jgi:hypothetical protein
MRKIENDMIGAINARIRNPLELRPWASGNTDVRRNETTNAIEVKLHRNFIAKIEHDGERATYVTLNDGGWQTVTTKSRLNAIAQAFNVSGVYQKKFSWYLDDGTPFEGEHRLKVNSRRKHAA